MSQELPSPQYRGMIYFAVATIHFYRNDLKAVRGQQTPEEFWDRNKAVVQRVCDEAIKYFDYELSHEQICRAIAAYLAPSASVTKSPPHPLHDQQRGV